MPDNIIETKKKNFSNYDNFEYELFKMFLSKRRFEEYTWKLPL